MREDHVIRAIYSHAEREFPKECCGMVSASGVVVPLENVADNPYQSFKISSHDYLKYSGDALFAYHSHPDRPAVASEGDLHWHDRFRLPLMIVSWPQGDIRMIGDPCKGKDLTGRSFIYGVYDCYSLVQDFYRRVLDYGLPTVTRPRFGWWQTGEVDPFNEGADRSGLRDVGSPEPGDMILFKMNDAKVPNHTGIYKGGNQLLHHRLLSLSTLTPYDDTYISAATRILRRDN